MESKIVIELLINGKTNGTAVQGKIFSFGLKITNISEYQSHEFTIKNIIIDSEKDQNARMDVEHDNIVKPLDPDESKIINLEKIGFPMHGLVNVSASVMATDPRMTISIFQKNSITNEISKTKIPSNRFIDFLVVKSSNEFAQEKASKLMQTLTFFMGAIALLQLVIAYWQFKLGETQIDFAMEQIQQQNAAKFIEGIRNDRLEERDIRWRKEDLQFQGRLP